MRIALALLRAEALKLRRSRLIWLVLGLPVATLAVHSMIIFDRTSPGLGNPATAWPRLLNSGWTFWSALTLPLFISLATAWLLNLEHRGDHWKQLFTWPLPRWGVYATKLLFSLLLVAASFVVIASGLIADVLLLNAVRDFGLETRIPWTDVLVLASSAILSCGPVIAIQTWIAARFRGYAVPLGMGMGATVIGLMFTSITTQRLAVWYPWMMPFAATRNVGEPLHPALVACLGVAIGVLVCWDLPRREV